MHIWPGYNNTTLLYQSAKEIKAIAKKCYAIFKTYFNTKFKIIIFVIKFEKCWGSVFFSIIIIIIIVFPLFSLCFSNLVWALVILLCAFIINFYKNISI